MQLSKIKLLIIIFLALSFTSAVYADSNIGWQGYGLYNISGSKIDIINEDVKIQLLKEKIIYEGEFLIQNHSNAVVKAVFGMPAQGIEKLALTEKNNVIKWKKRSYGSLLNEYNVENRIPQEDYWYVFNVTLNPAETKLLDIKFDALPQLEEGSLSFAYYNDRKLGFSNSVEKTSLYLDFNDFQPYNLLALHGIPGSQVGLKGDIVFKAEAENIDTIALQYLDTMQAAMNRFIASPMHKPREIALAFINKNYIKASALCDEYIQNPNDSLISQEEMKFIKAECLRRLQNYEKYLAIVETIDYNKMYPVELKNKIILDRLSIYLEQQNQEKLISLYKELEQDTTESTQILKTWIDNSSAFGAAQINTDNLFKHIQQDGEKEEQSSSIFASWYKAAMEYRYTPIIIFAAGLLLGLILRNLNFKKKRKRSMYIYRM